MPLGKHEDPAPNLPLWKKHDSGLPESKRISTARLLPFLPKNGGCKISRRTGSSISLSFLHSVPAGQCCLTAGKESPGCCLQHRCSPSSSPGQQQPPRLWVSRQRWRLIPVVLFHGKHRNFLEMAQKISFSV